MHILIPGFPIPKPPLRKILHVFRQDTGHYQTFFLAPHPVHIYITVRIVNTCLTGISQTTRSKRALIFRVLKRYWRFYLLLITERWTSARKIGRASGRERWGQYVGIAVGA